MNTEKRSVNTWRGEQAKWWRDMAPLLRRTAPRWGGCAVLLAALWVAGALFSARHEPAKPQVGLETFDVKDYLKRGRDIPEGDNAATVYLEAQKRLLDKKNWKSDSEEAFRICQNRRNESFKITLAHWQVLEAFAAETDGVAAQIRAAAQRPQCIFPLREDQYSYSSWESISAVAGCLVVRALAAGHQGNAAAWRQSTEDTLGFLESVGRDHAPAVVSVRTTVLGGLLQALEAAVASGAAGDDATLAALDDRLAALRPMDAFEPLLALAWSAMEFQHALYYGEAYPRQFRKDTLEYRRYYPAYMDIPYQAGGFAARDRALSAAYLSDLLGILRSGQPQAYERAWAWVIDKYRPYNVAGIETAPRYAGLSRETFGYGWWRGSPGALYVHMANIRMARAVIAVMRQGRDGQGHFRSGEELRALLDAFPCPMTGAPMSCRSDAGQCSLAYRIFQRGWRFQDQWDWQLRVVLDLPG